MKAILTLTCITLLTIQTSDSKFNLICHQWRLFGIKSFDKAFTPSKDPKDEVLTFHSDGTYDKLMYGQLTIKGRWEFRADSSKLVFGITSVNGANMPSFPWEKILPTDSIIQLTSDTLIDARLAYYGPQKVYGHDDWYYVKIDN